MSQTKSLPPRSKVRLQDCWNLESLFPDEAKWEAAFLTWSQSIGGYDRFRGKLAQNPKTLARCLRFDADFDRAGERLGTYAFLRTSEDQANSDYQRMKGR